MDTRSRFTNTRKAVTTMRFAGDPYGPSTDSYGGFQYTESEGHRVSKLGHTLEDIGGNFHTFRVKVDSIGRDSIYLPHSSSTWRDGPLWTSPLLYDLTTKGLPRNYQVVQYGVPDTFLVAHGTTAISRTAPTSPVASAAQFIGELREGLPRLPGTSGRPGGEYLNIEFGIKPLINDVNSFLDATANSTKILQQLERDSGKVVRRRYNFKTTKDVYEDVLLSQNLGGQHLNAYFFSAGKLTRTITKHRSVWFSGAYTYYLPPEGTISRRLSELNKLYGIRFDLNTIYQLSPYSWLVDWETSLGDVFQNLSLFSNDGLLLRHGYIMCRSHYDVTETWEGGLKLSPNVYTPSTLKSHYTVEVKQRLKATPYGFGLSLSSLSGRQLSILAALFSERVVR